MTKDYKNVSEKKSPAGKHKKNDAKASSTGIPGWIWLIAGLIIGGFISFLVFLKTNISIDETSAVKPSDKPVVAKKTETLKDSAEERFKFYEILPKREVSVPVDEIIEPDITQPKATTRQNEQTTKPSSQNTFYELQAGSFYRFKDADKRKASLAFLGIQAKIQAVKTREDKTLYRVRIGPYDNISKINKIENLLEQNNIKSLLIKKRG